MSEIFPFYMWEWEIAKLRESYVECVGLESYYIYRETLEEWKWMDQNMSPVVHR